MTYLLFGGGLYMVLIGIVWIVHPKRSTIHYYFAAMYVSTGLIVLYAWAERTGLIFQAYLLYNMQIPLCYLFAPLLYYGFSQITDLDRKPVALVSVRFLPFLVTLPLILIINLTNVPIFTALPEHASSSDLRVHPVFLFVHYLGIGSNLYIGYFLTRMLLTGIRFFRNTKLETIRELRLLLFFVAWFFLDILLMMAAHLTGNTDLLHGAKFLSSSTFILYSFYSFRYPEYAQQVVTKSRQIRYRNTQLRGLDTGEVLGRLQRLVEIDKVYREMDLSLSTLSGRLGITPHQLSEILNDHLGMNFATFLNSHRVEEAKRLLVGSPDTSVLEIAFEAGFNSKGSFNKHFRKHTGRTPRDYRRDPVG